MEQMRARWDREAQTKALQQQADAAEKQTLLMEKQAREQKRQQKKAKQQENRENGKAVSTDCIVYLLDGGWQYF
jgi:hypothetical protein